MLLSSENPAEPVNDEFTRWMGSCDENSVWFDHPLGDSLRRTVGKICGQRKIDQHWEVIVDSPDADELELLHAYIMKVQENTGLSLEKQTIVTAFIFSISPHRF